MVEMPELHLFLGRLEGKLDSLMTMHAGHTSRLEAVENRVAEIDRRVAAHDAHRKNSGFWLTTCVAVASAGFTGLAYVKDFFK